MMKLITLDQEYHRNTGCKTFHAIPPASKELNGHDSHKFWITMMIIIITVVMVMLLVVMVVIILIITVIIPPSIVSV